MTKKEFENTITQALNKTIKNEAATKTVKEYKVWFSIDQAYKVEAESKEAAREMIENGEVGDKSIVEEKNQEWIETI